MKVAVVKIVILANKTHGFEVYSYIIYQTDECLCIKNYYW